MIFFYIDESGTSLGDIKNPFFVLGCVAIDAREWQHIDCEVHSLKRRLVSWAKPEDWEIKGRDLRRGDGFFKSQNWPERAKAFLDIAGMLSEFRCQLLVVQIDKRMLPRSLETDADMYRLAFWRLLEEMNRFLEKTEQDGMILVDTRAASLHSSVQDRRLIDAYRDWLGMRSGRCRFVELPWFGFSAFYSGLQLADFVSYLVDFTHTEQEQGKRSQELYEAMHVINPKLLLVKIP